MRFWLLFRNRRARKRGRRSGDLGAGQSGTGRAAAGALDGAASGSPEGGSPGGHALAGGAAPGRFPARPGPNGRPAPPGSHRRTGPSRVTDARPGPGGPVPPPRSAPSPGAGTGTPWPPAPSAGAGPGTPRPPAPRPGSGRGGPPRTEHRRWGLARVAIRTAADAPAAAAPRPAPAAARTPGTALRAAQAAQAATPWYEVAQANRTAPGMRDCGVLERVLHREWSGSAPPEAVTAINRLADLPRLIKDRLVAGLDAIYVGGGGVPDLDDMGRLSGVPLPSGRATWDACAGAYGERKVVVGSRPSPTPDVMCHEIGHALDDIDGPAGHWQSDSDAFCSLYDQCLPFMVSNLHRQRGILGRREFFADAFAAIASRQRPALVDMLGGDTRAALNVMLYFNMRYGI
jgi:hypothetical protein